MPGKPTKRYRIRVKTLDGKPRDQAAINKLKSNQLGMPHIDIVRTAVPGELIICAANDKHIAQARKKLPAAGLEPIDDGDTTVAPPAPSSSPKPTDHRPQRATREQRGGRSHATYKASNPSSNSAPRLNKKPYGFVGLPDHLTTKAPVWHDGTHSAGRLSGEIRCELLTLTPLLVGWERHPADGASDWPAPDSIAGFQVPRNKPVLCPLRAPWGTRPVIIPGDTLKGLLRHELGALLGAPMERVAERSYSYRPNAMYPNHPANRFLVPRLARVPEGHVTTRLLDGKHHVRLPTRLELFPATLEYNKKAKRFDYAFDQRVGAPYRGGQGAGTKLNSKPPVHTSLTVQRRDVTIETVDVPQAAQDGFIATVRHLIDPEHGHFSQRHPDVPKIVTTEGARSRILEALTKEVFQPGDFIWVEWDTEQNCIVSFGWHYYYRWAYRDSVRKDADAPRLERHGLFPLDKERESDTDGAPKELSLVRRILGYTGDNEGSENIGTGDYTQLMGRVFVNAGLEVTNESESDDDRFLTATFLRELGMPRPSAVEYYLKQNLDAHGRPQTRSSDRATLLTYGDAAGYDEPGELAGRKFYLDRPSARAADARDTNKVNDRSTLALEASRAGRKFRFTVRFRDLDAAELAAILVALCPNQFKAVLGGTHPDGYCSKLGYARPLGWGSVCIEAKHLLLLDETSEGPTLRTEADLAAWVRKNHQNASAQNEWLAIHRRNHPDAADYPCAEDRDGNRNIHTFHTWLRAQHSQNRRYKRHGAE